MQKFCDGISRKVSGSPEERVRAFTVYARVGVGGVQWLADSIASAASGPADAVQRALDYCHALPHVADPTGPADWVADPCAVAVVGGDCDDLCVLLLALLFGMRVAGKIVWMPLPAQAQDHVVCQAFIGGRWLWADPFVRGARLGEHPGEAAYRLRAQLVEVP